MAFDWKQDPSQEAPIYYSKMMALLQLATDPFSNEVDRDLHSCLFSTKAHAMIIQLKTLTSMDRWEVIGRISKSNVLQSTWAFKFQRFPYWHLSQNKARFCGGGGHRHIEGVDFIKTVAPVVKLSTVRFFLILSQVLNLSTKQVDCIATFIHAPITDTMYVVMSEPGMVLKSKHSLFGLKQSPRNIFKYLKSYLEKCDFLSD
jgi:hypothetical protein